MSFYRENEAIIVHMLLCAHDSTKAIIRDMVLCAEYRFFYQHIQQQKVLVCGSGLGHDSCEIAGHNKEVVGVEVLAGLVAYAQKHFASVNVRYIHDDLMKLQIKQHFDSAVMNMGTIGNFNRYEQKQLISNILQLSDVLYFSFYPPTKKALKIRQKMYNEESWTKVDIVGTTLVSRDGLYSHSYTKEYFVAIAQELGAVIKFYDLLDFVIMAKVTLNGSSI